MAFDWEGVPADHGERIDIMFALQSGQPPMFFRDNVSLVRNLLAKDGLSLACHHASLFERYRELDPDLREVLQDIMGSCSLFNKNPKKTSLGMVAFLELVISICYRLLRFRLLPSSGKPVDTQAALHLGSIIVMMTVFIQLGKRRMIDYSLISRCLGDVLCDELLEADVELYLWLAVIGSIWISDDDQGGWIRMKVQEASRHAGLTSWNEVRECIQLYPWINSIHNEAGSAVWKSLQSME